MTNMDILSFEPDKEYLYQGKLHRIKSTISLDTVLLCEINTGENCTVKINELTSPDASPSEPKATPLPTMELTLVSSDDWKKAKEREAIIKPLTLTICTRAQADAAGQRLGLSTRQIYNLIKRYRDSGYQLRGLLFPKKSGGKGKTRLSNEVEVVIQFVIQDKYLSKQQIKTSIIIEEIRRRCFHTNIKAPCGNAIRKRIQQLSSKEITMKRRGIDGARTYQPIVGSTPIPEHPLATLQIDHTPVDLIIVDEIYRMPIGRPYLTVAIDVFSRCITGFCLTLEAPSSVSVGLCLTHSIFDKDTWLAERKINSSWSIWGKPSAIYVDNAPEFHS